MKQLLILLVLALALIAPVAHAQDTAVPPTIEFATDVPTLEPTVESTVEPTEVPGPSPIDESKIPPAAWAVIIVLVVGVVGVAYVGIVQAAKGLPEWAKPLLMNLVDSGVGSLDQYAHGTDTPIDDLAVEELKALVEKLRAELRVTQTQVTQNSSQIASVGAAQAAQSARQ